MTWFIASYVFVADEIQGSLNPIVVRDRLEYKLHASIMSRMSISQFSSGLQRKNVQKSSFNYEVF